MRHAAVALMIVVAILALTPSVLGLAGPGPNRVAAQQEDAAQIRDLAERLLTYTYPLADGTTARAQLLVGQLPADLPFVLPVPPGGRVIGSARRLAGSDTANVDVAIAAPGTPAQLLAFYDTALPAAGLYLAPSSYGGSGGFQPGAAKRSDSYCLSEAGPWLHVSAMESSGVQPGGETDVRVSITMRLPGAQTTPYPITYLSPCSTEMQSRMAGYGATSRLLPRLSGPPGVPLQSSGMSTMGQDYAMSSALATTGMSVTELERFFAEQLVAAGWMLRARGGEGPVAWSTWALPEADDQAGFLYVLEAPGEHRKRLTLQAESAAAGSPMTSPMYSTFSTELSGER